MLTAKYILKITKCTKSISNIIPWVDYLRHVQVWVQLEIETCLRNKYCPSLSMYTPMSLSTPRQNQSINQSVNKSIDQSLFIRAINQSIHQPINLLFRGEKQLLNGPDVQNTKHCRLTGANAITSIERPTSRVYFFVSLAHMKMKQKHKFIKHVLLRRMASHFHPEPSSAVTVQRSLRNKYFESDIYIYSLKQKVHMHYPYCISVRIQCVFIVFFMFCSDFCTLAFLLF